MTPPAQPERYLPISSCEDCPHTEFVQGLLFKCDLTGIQIKEDWSFPEWCPLSPRPAPAAPAPNQHVCPHLEYRNDVGFCHYHDNPIQLNTMPEGTTCEECQRFRKPECPYPGSNITMNKCKAFLINLQHHDASIRNQTLIDICKICGAEEYGACVGEDCPVGAYRQSQQQKQEKQ